MNDGLQCMKEEAGSVPQDEHKCVHAAVVVRCNHLEQQEEKSGMTTGLVLTPDRRAKGELKVE